MQAPNVNGLVMHHVTMFEKPTSLPPIDISTTSIWRLRCAGTHQVLLIRCGVIAVLPTENSGSV